MAFSEEQTASAALERIFAQICRHRHAAVAFSGGVDSAVVLCAAVKCLGPERVAAITADSPSLARSELTEAQRLASELGVRHLLVSTAEMENPLYVRNDAERCYHCKSTFYRAARSMAEQLRCSGTGQWVLLDGTNADDLGDIRPGLRAAGESGVFHPLADAGVTKEEVRALARLLGLDCADKQEMACLASRISPGTTITAEKLAAVEKAEHVLRELGFSKFRVRYHELPGAASLPAQSLARIELDAAEIARAAGADLIAAIGRAVKGAGFTYVTLDLEGYKKGGRPRGE